MKIYKVLPDLTRKRQMAIWHKALRSQWSAEDLDWGRPQRIAKDKPKDHLARLLTPILMGEQSALYSVSGLIPKLGATSEVESQFYLTTWAVDEARHTELFTRFYRRLDREPISIRRFPAGYLFQSAIVSDDAAEWLSGVLISEVLAKLVMEEFRRLDLDPLLSDIANGILEDEARHLGFNHIYLEDRFTSLFRKGRPEGQSYGEHLRARLQAVLDHVTPIFDALGEDMQEVGLDRDWLLGELDKDAKRRLEKSIAAGEKVASREVEASDPAEAAAIGRE
ncbi:MAG: ferritin-like domain-containing protein [Planctomycetota bacterium]|nr:ferritin-like domain-containing protein [Planctomycetota bacterium]